MTTVEFEECDSTNEEAWRLARAGTMTLVLARRQRKGRGRQGRRWESGREGNLFCSLACDPPSKNLDWLPLAAGVAATEAIEEAVTAVRLAAPLTSLRLKWPNDVYRGDAKIGGILCESRMSGERCTGVVVGFGLNLVEAPRVLDMKTACLAPGLRGARAEITRLGIARLWAERLAFWMARLSSGNTRVLRAAWKKHAKLGRFPDVRTHDAGGKLVRLRAVDLDERGRLRAQGEEGKIVYLENP